MIHDLETEIGYRTLAFSEKSDFSGEPMLLQGYRMNFQKASGLDFRVLTVEIETAGIGDVSPENFGFISRYDCCRGSCSI